VQQFGVAVAGTVEAAGMAVLMLHTDEDTEPPQFWNRVAGPISSGPFGPSGFAPAA
jgi:hypothetical protein